MGKLENANCNIATGKCVVSVHAGSGKHYRHMGCNTACVLPLSGTTFRSLARPLFAPWSVLVQMPYAKWVSFCSKTREVHALGKSIDFNKGVCRKSLTSGTR